MKRLAVLHTVHSVIDPFAQKLHRQLGDTVVVYHLLDEYLSIDPNQSGGFTLRHMRRLTALVDSAIQTGANLIACTCSTLSESLARLKASVPVPIICIDEAMIRQAIAADKPVTILATAPSAVLPLTNGLKAEALRQNKRPPGITVHEYPDAFAALQLSGKARHDEILLRETAALQPQGIVLLAQASMAHLREELRERLHCTVLDAPDLCVRQISEKLEEL